MTIREIIDRIVFFRNRADISARELSLRIGKHSTYISKLEARDFNLPVAALIEIINALGITCSEFFADNYKTYNQDKQLMDLIKSLRTEQKDNLIGLLKK